MNTKCSRGLRGIVGSKNYKDNSLLVVLVPVSLSPLKSDFLITRYVCVGVCLCV